MAQNDPKEQTEKLFSLAPAIFTPFPGLSTETPPLNQAQRIERALENLNKQQDAVKRNMMFLVERRNEELVENAKKELETAEESDDGMGRDGGREEEMRELIRRVKVPRSKEVNYEVKAGEFAEKGKRNDGDVEMGGMNKRTAEVIRAELSKELRDLVNVGATEMERYDGHVRRMLRQNKEYLDRVKSRGAMSASTVVSAGGAERDINVRRMSGGNPFSAYSTPVSPLKDFEKLEALARRESR